MENRFISYTNRVAQNVLGRPDLVNEPATITSIAQTCVSGPHFSAKTGGDVYTIYAELDNRPGITIRLTGKASIANLMKAGKKGDRITFSGKFNEGDAALNSVGKLKRMPVVFLEGNLTDGTIAFKLVGPGAEVVTAEGQTKPVSFE